MNNRLILKTVYYILCSLIFLAVSPLNASSVTYFIGHLNPDTDSIVSSIAAAQFYGGVAARTGDLNKESQYLLERTHTPIPILIRDFEDKDVGIVDFNQRTQAPPTLISENITMIIDHHALGDKPFIFAKPIMITIKPWGSTASILSDMFVRDKRQINKELATLLLGAIVSDTLGLHSPTTTDKDRELAGLLQKIAGVDDLDCFAKEMFIAKSDIDRLSAQQLLMADYKIFDIKGNKIGIGVCETINPEKLVKRKYRLLKAMKYQKHKDKLSYIYFIAVDILRRNSTILLLGEREKSLAETAFKLKSQSQLMVLHSVVSRKNQIIPLINNAL